MNNRKIVSKANRFLVLLVLCGSNLFAQFKEGYYRAVLSLDPEKGVELPFNIMVKGKKKPTLTIINADEKIEVKEICFKKDSVFIQMPVFDTEFRCVFKGNDLEGIWVNHYRKEKNVIPFKAYAGDKRRFITSPVNKEGNVEGKWAVTFSKGTKDSSMAIGLFHHLEQTDFINGTFLTETGDYRYLDGIKNGNQLMLSCFDGSHAFLFTAEISANGQTMNGNFYSGSHWKENWNAERRPEFELRDPSHITYMKNKDEVIDISFKDMKGMTVTLHDKRFQNKPVILQVMGSWCPNCMDESAYLTEVYKKYSKNGLEIVAISFEKTQDELKARQQVERLIKRFNIQYTVLLSLQTGKDKASAALPFLNGVSAFPTTLFLNRDHKAVRIHTGFSGPATGNEYLRYQESTEALIKQLLKE